MDEELVIKIQKKEIKSMDDLAKIFFDIGKFIGHPIKELEIELTESWGEQNKK